MSQGFLIMKMMVERPFGDISGGENCIYTGTLEAFSVDFPKSGLQQAFPCTLWITEPWLRLVTV
jgi:hypothetical protein